MNGMILKTGLIFFLWTGSVALVAFWGLPEPSVPSHFSAEESLDDQPVLLRYETLAAYRALKQRRIWGESSGPSSAQSEKKNSSTLWTLRGVVHQGGRSAALIEQEGKVARYLVNESLPDGSRLVTIKGSLIVVSDKNGQRFEYVLHQGAP